jgi:hypothetical protein
MHVLLCLDLRMPHIDITEMYRSDYIEELVAEAIAGRRDRVFPAKVLRSNTSHEGTCEGMRLRYLVELSIPLKDMNFAHIAPTHD